MEQNIAEDAPPRMVGHQTLFELVARDDCQNCTFGKDKMEADRWLRHCKNVLKRLRGVKL